MRWCDAPGRCGGCLRAHPWRWWVCVQCSRAKTKIYAGWWTSVAQRRLKRAVQRCVRRCQSCGCRCTRWTSCWMRLVVRHRWRSSRAGHTACAAILAWTRGIWRHVPTALMDPHRLSTSVSRLSSSLVLSALPSSLRLPAQASRCTVTAAAWTSACCHVLELSSSRSLASQPSRRCSSSAVCTDATSASRLASRCCSRQCLARPAWPRFSHGA
mmetsp:Transcript_17417/g.44818  ORF Transcript_17417/g.44818 Transcript_17417/m.44818 type:complete len:213 (-) Transcript_17417:552-1190(-)